MLRGIEIHVGDDREVVGEVTVVEDLANVPDVVGLLVRVVDHEVRVGTGIGIEKELVVLVVERVEGLAPRAGTETPFGVNSPSVSTSSLEARRTRRNRALRTSTVSPRRSSTTASPSEGGAASSALPAASHSSTRLESTDLTTKPSHATISFKRSSRFGSGTVRSSERNASER